jgi:hypothetical protein
VAAVKPVVNVAVFLAFKIVKRKVHTIPLLVTPAVRQGLHNPGIPDATVPIVTNFQTT